MTTWKSTTRQLGDALEEWKTISEQVKKEPKLAPDEQMLKNVDLILRHLKEKLDEFSGPTEAPSTKLTDNNLEK